MLATERCAKHITTGDARCMHFFFKTAVLPLRRTTWPGLRCVRRNSGWTWAWALGDGNILETRCEDYAGRPGAGAGKKEGNGIGVSTSTPATGTERLGFGLLRDLIDTCARETAWHRLNALVQLSLVPTTPVITYVIGIETPIKFPAYKARFYQDCDINRQPNKFTHKGPNLAADAAPAMNRHQDSC